jgi:hypothetical protein
MAAELRWIRSSYSGDGTANCVECAGDGAAVLIRDSKDRAGHRLEVPPVAWHAFLDFVAS